MTSIKQRCGGLLVFLCVTIVILFEVVNANGEDCSYSNRKCKDLHLRYCFQNYNDLECEESATDALVCPVSCGICKPCIHKPFECERNCYDSAPTLFCQWMKFLKYCYLTRKCRKTCGNCVPCKLPPKFTPNPTTCTPNCFDRDWECAKWEREGHCNSTSTYSKHVKSLCKKACKECTPCGPHY